VRVIRLPGIDKGRELIGRGVHQRIRLERCVGRQGSRPNGLPDPRGNGASQRRVRCEHSVSYGAGQHRSELDATFLGTSNDLTLQATDYDIDDSAGDGFAVCLNGDFLGYRGGFIVTGPGEEAVARRR